MKNLITLIALVFAYSVLGAADDAGKRPPEIEVNVTGYVGRPGVVRLLVEEKPMLTMAISRAGSFTRMADRRAVVVTSKTGTEKTYDVDEIGRGKAPDPELRDGDTIFVPERY